MTDHKVGIIYSSFNNYDLFAGEVLQRVDFKELPVVNVDDHSSDDEAMKGRRICNEHNIEFLVNDGKGVQLAVETGIKFLKEKYNVEWILCLQQDVFPLCDFFNEFEKSIKLYDLSNVGAIGFNNLEREDYFTRDSFGKYKRDGFAKGLLGSFF